MPREEALAVLRRVGREDLIPEAERELPDPVDLDELQRFGERHGATRGRLIDKMGGSP
jgi:hypothetical protein